MAQERSPAVPPPGVDREEPASARVGRGDGERRMDYHRLMKKVEEVVASLDGAGDVEATVRAVVEAIIRKFRDELGITGGRLYRRRARSYVLEATFGSAKPIERGFRVAASYRPVQLVLEERTVFMDSGDRRLNRRLERRLGVDKFAALEVGEGEHLLAFDVAHGQHREDILYSLGIIRHSINQRLREEHWAGIVRQARRIQSSILPRRTPVYGPFEVAGRTELLDNVGGDFYDYIHITDKILGLAIADVSGHGLPAALQVRDIHMGLRMGMSRDLKIVRTVERMNAIIHQSTLTSRFVSMFYGELELSGLFIYVNAGHPPPFHLAADGTVRRLEEGGAVLGPLPDATYERGFVRLEPGDVLVLYTDGITETRGLGEMAETEYGFDRLVAVVHAWRGEPAERIVEAIFGEIRRFCGGAAAEDDRTVVVVRRPAVRPTGPAAGAKAPRGRSRGRSPRPSGEA